MLILICDIMRRRHWKSFRFRLLFSDNSWNQVNKQTNWTQFEFYILYSIYISQLASIFSWTKINLWVKKWNVNFAITSRMEFNKNVNSHKQVTQHWHTHAHLLHICLAILLKALQHLKCENLSENVLQRHIGRPYNGGSLFKFIFIYLFSALRWPFLLGVCALIMHT